MFVPTKATVKLANVNTRHSQGIGIILCCFTNCSIIYTLGPVYYFPSHHYNTISSGSLKYNVGSQKVAPETLEHCDFFDPQGRSWRSTYQTQNNIDYLKIKIIKFNSHRDRHIIVTTVCAQPKNNILQIIHQHFGHVSITILKRIARKGLMEGLPENLPDLEELFPICL